jgi:hypothetical protein
VTAAVRSLGRRLCAAFALSAAAAAPLFAAQAAPAAAPTIEWDPWYALGPIDQPGGAANVGDPRPVEDELARQFPGKEGPDLSRTYQGKGQVAANWRELRDSDIVGAVPELGAIDLTKLCAKDQPANDASAYLYRRVRAKAPATVTAKLGYDDAARLWLNGRLVGESRRPGAYEPLSDTLTLELAAGDNHLFVKVTNGGGAWKFRLQPLDAKPLAGRAAAQEKVNRAIDRGCDYLIARQLRDGSWAFDDARFPGGMTALAVYALLKSGISPRHQAVQRGVAYLRARPTRHTYTAGCTLLMLWALHDSANDEWAADVTDELLSWQQAGVWGYPEDQPDLSNTQYAVLGLLAAARCGVDVPQKAWRDVIGQVLHYQGRSGGFGYRIGDGAAPTGSMTAAGLSVLAIARDQLVERSGKNALGLQPAEAALEAGARWLGERFTVSGSPPQALDERPNTHRGPYYLYGVERLCTLLGLERLGGSDWYWEGASWFLDAQGAKGEFSSGYDEHEPNTCFGLLFLGRATATFTGKGAARKDSVYQTDDEKSEVWVRASGNAQLAVWLGGFSKRIAREYGWQTQEPRGLHVAKVEYLVDGEVAATLNGNASKTWSGEKFSTQLRFEHAGVRSLSVRVHLMLEPATAGGDPGALELASTPIEIDVNEVAAPHLLAQATLGSRSLVDATGTRITASTQFSDSPAAAAIDGRESSGWTSMPEDKRPTLTLEFERPVRAAQVGFSPLGGRPDALGEWDRATKVELKINKQDPILTVLLETDELRTTIFDLPRPGQIRTLEIRVVERATGKRFPGRVGFNEISLFGQSSSRK